MTRNLIIILFAAISSFHLYFSWKNDEKRRAMTKPFLLLCLILYYLYSEQEWSVWVILGLVFCWAGDILLIWRGKRWFMMGGASFFLGHIAFDIAVIHTVRSLDIRWMFILSAAAVYIMVLIRVIGEILDTLPKMMIIPMGLYLLSNCVMNLFALIRLLGDPGLSSVLLYAGALFFFVSDCILFLVRFHRNRDLVRRKHFSVMAAYLAACALITISFTI
ncbi:MAG: lysoplasmalogenase [Solobacterium sp.]|nr:lysoplasmalogenase [Solobacterium sp.]